MFLISELWFTTGWETNLIDCNLTQKKKFIHLTTIHWIPPTHQAYQISWVNKAKVPAFLASRIHFFSLIKEIKNSIVLTALQDYFLLKKQNQKQNM